MGSPLLSSTCFPESIVNERPCLIVWIAQEFTNLVITPIYTNQELQCFAVVALAARKGVAGGCWMT